MKISDVRLYDLVPEDLIFMLHHLTTDIDGLREYSPINDEDTPSCFIYYNTLFKKYQFKDFSSGESGGAFKYIALKYNVDIDQAKTLVHNTIVNYLLGKRELPDILPKKATIEKVDKILEEYERLINTPIKSRRYRGINFNVAKCEYTLCSYDDTAYRYFANYGLTKKDIEHYNIYTLCDVIIKGSKNIKEEQKDEDLDNIQSKHKSQKCIGYFNKAGHLLQIYIPKELNNGNKRFFTLRPDITPHIKATHRHSLILASSIKDMICVHKCLRLMGLHKEMSVATFYNERKEATEQQIEILRSLISKKGTIYILYDNDNAGVENSKALYEQLITIFPSVINVKIDIYNVQGMVLDDNGIGKITTFPIKDFADICRYMGLVQAQSWLYHHIISPKHRHDIAKA